MNNNGEKMTNSELKSLMDNNKEKLVTIFNKHFPKDLEMSEKDKLKVTEFFLKVSNLGLDINKVVNLMRTK